MKKNTRTGRVLVRFFLRLADLMFYIAVAYSVSVLLEIRNSSIIWSNIIEVATYVCFAGFTSALADEVRSKHGMGEQL